MITTGNWPGLGWVGCWLRFDSQTEQSAAAWTVMVGVGVTKVVWSQIQYNPIKDIIYDI